VQRFSGNPKAWGIVLTVLGVSFFLQTFLNFRFVSKFILPVLLIGLGVYLLRQYVFKPKQKQENRRDFDTGGKTPTFGGALNDTAFNSDDSDYVTKTRVRNWKNR
jgi:predicted membrane protein